WNLRELARHYRDFLAGFGRLRPAAGEPTLRAQLRLVHEWRRFPFLDPQLPAELLPPDWIGRRAGVLFRDRHRAWHAEAQPARGVAGGGGAGVAGLARRRPGGRRPAGRLTARPQLRPPRADRYGVQTAADGGPDMILGGWAGALRARLRPVRPRGEGALRRVC